MSGMDDCVNRFRLNIDQLTRVEHVLGLEPQGVPLLLIFKLNPKEKTDLTIDAVLHNARQRAP